MKWTFMGEKMGMRMWGHRGRHYSFIITHDGTNWHASWSRIGQVAFTFIGRFSDRASAEEAVRQTQKVIGK
jgi:hypothetical protein